MGVDGTIHGVIVGDHTETAGLGAKAAEPEYQGSTSAKESAVRGEIKPADSERGDHWCDITSRVTDVNTVSEFYAALTGGAK